MQLPGSRTQSVSSCGEQAELLCGMCDLLGPGIEPMSSALSGGVVVNLRPKSHWVSLIGPLLEPLVNII